MPTVDRDKKKLGVVEMVLYNMASFLGSFAAGFDIRASNLLPQPVPHPKLQNLNQIQSNELEAQENLMYKEIYHHDQDILNVGNPHMNKLYGMETYHGQAKHKNR
jgi:hypothetical protein